MYWLLFIFLYFVQQPLETLEQEKMAMFMVKKNKVSLLYARPLVRAIYREAERKDLDPTVLAAMVWSESWFDTETEGTSGERGVWQIWPWASPAIDIGWDQLRKMELIGDFPDKPWKKIPLKIRRVILKNIDIGSYLAVTLVSMLRTHCIRKEHIRRHPTDTYAHFNSGYRAPKRNYANTLWRYTKVVRRVIGRPEVTSAEIAWMKRRRRGSHQ